MIDFISISFVSQLLLNAEGTRFTEKKHEASIQFARERGMTELKHHLIPRTKGFTASLKPLKAKCPCILDIQLAFKRNDTVEPTIGNLLHGRAITGHMYVQRIDINTVPADETAAAEWMQELFRKKDRLQDSFHTHGDFFTGTGLTPLKPIVFSPTIGTIGNTIFWSIFTVTPIVYYLVKLLCSGELLYFSLAIAIILVCEYFDFLAYNTKSYIELCNDGVNSHFFFSFLFLPVYVLMQKTIGMSKISKGSSYGAKSS